MMDRDSFLDGFLVGVLVSATAVWALCQGYSLGKRAQRKRENLLIDEAYALGRKDSTKTGAEHGNGKS
jgi:hypothetical protein